MRSCEPRSEEHTSELQSRRDLVCRLLLENKKSHHPRVQQLTRNVNGKSQVNTHIAAVVDVHCSSLSCRWSVVTVAWIGLTLFFFNDAATTEIYTLSLHAALPI